MKRQVSFGRIGLQQTHVEFSLETCATMLVVPVLRVGVVLVMPGVRGNNDRPRLRVRSEDGMRAAMERDGLEVKSNSLFGCTRVHCHVALEEGLVGFAVRKRG